MDLCIVCAGTGELNPALAYALEEPAIRTNVAGWTASVDWACGFFERQGAGHLVCVTSVGGLRGSGAAPGLQRFESLPDQLCRGGFGSVSPGCGFRSASPTSGPVSRRRRWPGAKAFFWVMPVERVVGQILRAIRRRKAVAVVTRRWRLVAWILRRLPDRIYLNVR